MSFEVVNNIIQNHNSHESFQSVHIDENYQNLSLLFNMQGISSTPPKINNFVIGSLSKRNMKKSIIILKQLIISIEGFKLIFLSWL